ncbi:uncharacterized protein SCODWIG_00112 [Saccharomycodes ludwigii]|uniref:Uncharacterized protein n=1 Tax=Saccharomycodes ludwigii TaxID=36035 RepID=A0A376B142_9ASCO|nr:hypothetical protein SCDLUD_004176 [Saccharomycodes ludwigii]KAH3899876.1 hypothetical protein SCDLUD_004176 [Saccharomycodes ludwigii]SSD58351.1 uncharacterized protein SCODWIG_00112 [Saccharomycodes ludwigii]
MSNDIISVFVTSFDVKKGNELLWNENLQNENQIGNEIVDLTNIEFKTLPSGLHEAKDLDVVQFIVPKKNTKTFNEHFQGISVFKSNASECAAKSYSTHVDRSLLEMYSLGIALRTSATDPYSYVGILKELIQTIDIKARNFGNLRDCLVKFKLTPDNQTKRYLPTGLFKDLGPLIFPLWKACLLNERIIIINEDYAYSFDDLSTLVYYLFTISNGLEEPFYNIGLHDMSYLENKYISEEYNGNDNGEVKGYVASTGDSIVKEWTIPLYDKLLVLKKNEIGMYNYYQKRIQVTPLDLWKMRGSKINPHNVENRSWFQFFIDNLYLILSLGTIAPPYQQKFLKTGFDRSTGNESEDSGLLNYEGGIEPPIDMDIFRTRTEKVLNCINEFLQRDESSVASKNIILSSELMKLGLDGFSNQDIDFVKRLANKIDNTKNVSVKWFDTKLFL